jgi:hypothetical protein
MKARWLLPVTTALGVGAVLGSIAGGSADLVYAAAARMYFGIFLVFRGIVVGALAGGAGGAVGGACRRVALGALCGAVAGAALTSAERLSRSASQRRAGA